MALRVLGPSSRSTTQPSAPLSMPKSAAGMGHRDTDEVIEHFAVMQAGKDAMTGACHDPCKRKGIDPGTRRSVARAAMSFKDVANRHVRARSDGHPCKRPSRPGMKAPTVHSSPGDPQLPWLDLTFIDCLGNSEMTEQRCADLVSDLATLPQRHD